MATPIVVNPTQPSQVVVNGTQKSGTPIKVTTDLDYNRVQSMIDEAVGDVSIDTTNVASKDVEKFFGLPAALPEGYEFMSPEEVCSTLEEIMTSMDINLTPEQAKEITNNTLQQ